MVRFIDLTDQISDDTKEFAFYNTSDGKFMEFSGEQTFETLGDFLDCYDGCNRERFERLIPKDFF